MSHKKTRACTKSNGDGCDGKHSLIEVVDNTDGTNLSEIKLKKVYTDGKRLYRPIGWIGKNKVVYEEVKLYMKYYGNFGQYRQARVKKVKGGQLYNMTLNQFSSTMEEPLPGLVDELLRAEGYV